MGHDWQKPDMVSSAAASMDTMLFSYDWLLLWSQDMLGETGGVSIHWDQRNDQSHGGAMCLTGHSQAHPVWLLLQGPAD